MTLNSDSPNECIMGTSTVAAFFLVVLTDRRGRGWRWCIFFDQWVMCLRFLRSIAFRWTERWLPSDQRSDQRGSEWERNTCSGNEFQVSTVPHREEEPNRWIPERMSNTLKLCLPRLSKQIYVTDRNGTTFGNWRLIGIHLLAQKLSLCVAGDIV